LLTTGRAAARNSCNEAAEEQNRSSPVHLPNKMKKPLGQNDAKPVIWWRSESGVDDANSKMPGVSERRGIAGTIEYH
jgi:hypothetical protein